MLHLPKAGYVLGICSLVSINISRANMVSQIKATYRNGQVFITWKNVNATNQIYKVYRSNEKIETIGKLNSSDYLGYVIDNSGKNIRKSNLKDETDYFVINDGSSPLASNSGLYVVTCTDNKAWYYAVTVEDIASGHEDKNMTLGMNSLTNPVQEYKSAPVPVLQNTIALSPTSTSYEYVIWGNNQDVSTMPAFNNVGSYGYNFTFIRHSSSDQSLYVLFRDDDPFSDYNPENCDQCSILLIDDWLPNGSGTYWFGYNENYDIYSDSNPVQSSGTIHAYTQARVKFILTWVTKNLSINPNLVYASGSSHNGFGALLTANLIPDMIAAEWLSVPPPVVKASGGSSWEDMWCPSNTSFQTDVLNPVTGLTMNIWDVFDMRNMFELNTKHGIPYIGAVNGRQDNMIGWVQQLHWYDSLEYSMEGGVWYWDERQHNGVGKQFDDNQINTDLKRFSLTKSFPAFSYCTINQDPGNGGKNNGDDYGAINGYLDWDDSSIVDQKCNYFINCFIKDMYLADGTLLTQYDTCSTDITFRRLQKFKPSIGQTVYWTVVNTAYNQIAASGSFVYEGSPITLYGVPIYRSGSTINLHTKSCLEIEDSSNTKDANVLLFRNPDGYTIDAQMTKDDNVQIRVFDLTGRLVMDQNLEWFTGENEFKITGICRGDYILQITSSDLNYNKKLFF